MAFKKGVSGNPTGKPPGSQNKISKAFKEIIQTILEKELESFPQILENLKDKDRAILVIKLLEFVLPKNGEDKGKCQEKHLWELISDGTIVINDEPDYPLPEFKTLN